MNHLIVPLILTAGSVAAAQSRTVPAWIKDGTPKDQPTRLIDDLHGFRAGGSLDLSRFGGWKGKTLKATGFFRTERVGDRWWMIDPEGHPFGGAERWVSDHSWVVPWRWPSWP
ncbi:MAG: hypothetical protein WBD40_05485 [Tepidisphaeraceae bacterium]